MTFKPGVKIDTRQVEDYRKGSKRGPQPGPAPSSGRTSGGGKYGGGRTSGGGKFTNPNRTVAAMNARQKAGNKYDASPMQVVKKYEDGSMVRGDGAVFDPETKKWSKPGTPRKKV